MIALPRPRGASYVRPALFITATFIILGLVGLLSRYGGSGSTPPPPVVPVQAQQVIVEARGRVVPIAWANLSSSVPGKISQITGVVGTTVNARQELLRVDTIDGSVSILSPYRATVAYVTARVGETVLPGQTLVTVGDLSRYQVETTDLDEFSVARVFEGQTATLIIDALDEQTVTARVTSVAMMGITGTAGDVTYPVRIDFDSDNRNLRWGMSARIKFQP